MVTCRDHGIGRSRDHDITKGEFFRFGVRVKVINEVKQSS